MSGRAAFIVTCFLGDQRRDGVLPGVPLTQQHRAAVRALQLEGEDGGLVCVGGGRLRHLLQPPVLFHPRDLT